MTGGPRGPVPKRSEQRRRRNKPDGAEVVRVDAGRRVELREADPEWHLIAREWFESLSRSGQSQFYEPSDWATARFIAEAMSRNLNPEQRFSAQLFASVLSGMTELLTTEGARRRARVELERVAEDEPPQVAIMEGYRKRLKRDGAG